MSNAPRFRILSVAAAAAVLAVASIPVNAQGRPGGERPAGAGAPPGARGAPGAGYGRPGGGPGVGAPGPGDRRPASGPGYGSGYRGYPAAGGSYYGHRPGYSGGYYASRPGYWGGYYRYPPRYWGGYYGYRPGYRGGYYGYRPGYWGGYWGAYYGPSVGVYLGSPWYGYGYPYAYGGYPYWGYAPSTAYITVDPLEYVERPAASPQPEGGAWYYCIDPPGYFPHVDRCSRPWVVVQPSDVSDAPRPQ